MLSPPPYGNTGYSPNMENNPILKPKIPTNTPINIIELKIKMDTNIAELTTIPFTRQMLYVPPEIQEDKNKKLNAPLVAPTAAIPQQPPTQQWGGQIENIYDLNDNPFFTYSVEYPLRLLKTYTYEKAIQFFFNSKIFNEVLTEELVRLKRTPEYDETKENTYERRNEIVDKNILTMLTMLFPTRHPVANDVTTSYDYIMKSKILPFKLPLIQTTLPVHYSFLKLIPFVSDKVFTVNKVVWVNDFLNSPDYNQIVNNYTQTKKNFSFQLKENEISIQNYKQKLAGIGQNDKRYQEFEKKIAELGSQNKSIIQSIENPFEGMQNIIKQMSVGNRKSSNILLQNLLDEKVTKDEFNTFLKYLSGFVSNESTGLQLTEEEKKEFQTMLNVGVTYIQDQSFQNYYGNRQPIQQRKIESIEINVFVNLFDKELNEKFDISQDCDFKSEFLGNELQEYLNEKQEKTLSKNKDLNLVAVWDIHRNRPVIHLGEKYFNSSFGNTSTQNPNQNINYTNNINPSNIGYSNNMNNQYTPSEESTELDNWLLKRYTGKSFEKELNNFQSNGFLREPNFVEYLKKEGFADLLGLVKEFYKTTKMRIEKDNIDKQNIIKELSDSIRKLNRGFDIKLDEYRGLLSREPRNKDYQRGMAKYTLITKFCDFMVETINDTMNKIKTTMWNGWDSVSGGKKRKSRKQSNKKKRQTRKTSSKRRSKKI
jgi:hypothetical protein